MDALGGPDLCRLLNKDCLEEVCSHISAADLLALRQSCNSFAQLLKRSEKVWVRRLKEDYGLSLKARPKEDVVFIQLARAVYEASRTTSLRFQGAFVNGGVDEDATMNYWADNVFRADRSAYCSNCSENADCVALLLDGEVPRDAEYERARAYMIQRSRYAAALVMNVQLPEQGRDPEAVVAVLQDWSPAQLEAFFRDLVAALNQNHALGRMMLFDIAHDQIQAEQQRINAVLRYLHDRPAELARAIYRPPDEPNQMFDKSVLEKIADPSRHQHAGVVMEVTLSRAGSLTCPVASGVLLVGGIDYHQLKGLDEAAVCARLNAATQDPRCATFNSLDSAGKVLMASLKGQLPRAVLYEECTAGAWIEFEDSPALPAAAGASAPPQHGSAPAATSSQHRPAAGEAAACSIAWKPVLWFSFHTFEQAQAFVSTHAALVERLGSAATVRHFGPGTSVPVQPSVVAAGTVPVGPEQPTEPAAAAQATDWAGSAGAPSMAAAPVGAPNGGDLASPSEGPDGSQSEVGSDLASPVHGVEGGAGAAPWAGEVPVQQQGEEAAAEGEQEEGAFDAEDAMFLDEGSSSEEEEPGGAGPALPMVGRQGTRGRNKLHVQLSRPVAGNVVLLKLINQENLMDVYGDPHSWPNLDMTYCGLSGKLVRLPAGVCLDG